MNQNIDQALQKIELSKKVISEAELILADLLGKDIVEKVNEVIPVEETTPPRTDLECYLCGSKVYDNRPNKRSGQYKPKAPDFTCSNNNDCSGMVQGQSRMLRKSWWLDSKDLPQDWIKTKVPPAEDTVVIQDNEDGMTKESPF